MKTKENIFNILLYQVLSIVELRFSKRFVENSLVNLSVKHLTFEIKLDLCFAFLYNS